VQWPEQHCAAWLHKIPVAAHVHMPFAQAPEQQSALTWHVAPGVGAALCLVFLSAATELTATLILIPTNAETLATQFWAYQQNLSYGQAAPFALMMIAVAAVPSYVLSRFFDRLPRRGLVQPRQVAT